VILVTVVIPCYNHENYIADAIESVLDQDYPEIELLVINDGSTDNSLSRIKQVYEKRGGFRFIDQKNTGLVSVLAKGVSTSEGKYFCQLASDDKLPVTSISRRVEYLENHAGAVIVCTDAYKINGTVTTDQRVTSTRIKEMYNSEDQVEAIITGSHPLFSSGLIRREALMKCGGFDDIQFRYYEDLDTPIRLAASGRIGYIDEPLFYRREHGANVSSDRSMARIEIIRCYEKIYGLNRFDAYKKILSYRLMRSYLALGRAILSGVVTTDEGVKVFRDGVRPYMMRHPFLFYCWLRISVINN
tara:strand:- start:44658 stop:45560 length:903 start_codon:yes stop_codon:yes gene_type:complete